MKTKLLPIAAYEVAEVELIYKTKIDFRKRPKVNGICDAKKLLISHWDENKIELQEQFKVLLLSNSNRVLAIYEASAGGISSTIVDASLIFATALKARANAIILAHNHPSGIAKPTESDIIQTHKLVAAGRLFSIPVLDHIIVAKCGYFSFSENNLLTGCGLFT